MPIAILLILSAALYRLVPHPWNVAPVGALALLGGLYFNRRLALLIPLAVLVLTDFFLNASMGHPLWHWARLIDYSAFAAIGLLGMWCRSRSFSLKLGAALVTPFTFFLLSNFGVWLFGLGLNGLVYDRSMAGLLACYTAGLPFLRGTVLGDWGFLGAFALALFGLRHWVAPRLHWLTAPARA